MIRIVSAKPLSGYRLQVAFNDGMAGIFSVEPEQRGGVFNKLLDAKIFNAVTINPDFGCVEWPGGIDLDPSAMRRAMNDLESPIELESSLALNEDRKPPVKIN